MPTKKKSSKKKPKTEVAEPGVQSAPPGDQIPPQPTPPYKKQKKEKDGEAWVPEAPPTPPTPKSEKPKKSGVPVDEIIGIVQKGGGEPMRQAVLLETELKKRGISRGEWVKALIAWRKRR